MSTISTFKELNLLNMLEKRTSNISSVCEKKIFNMSVLSWENNTNILSCLFTNNYQNDSNQENTNQENICSDKINIIDEKGEMASSTLCTELFKLTTGYQGHVNVTSMSNKLINKDKEIYWEQIDVIIDTCDLIIFAISINSFNMKDELEILTSLCEQINNNNFKNTLIIIIDDCNALKYNNETNDFVFTRLDSDSIKEEELCSQVSNLITSRTRKYKLNNNYMFNNIIKMSSSKAALYNNFTIDLSHLTAQQVNRLCVNMCGVFFWDSCPPHARIDKLKNKISNWSEEDKELHNQYSNNTGFSKLNEKISNTLIKTSSNKCFYNIVLKIIEEIEHCTINNKNNFDEYLKNLITESNKLQELNEILGFINLSENASIKDLVDKMFEKFDKKNYSVIIARKNQASLDLLVTLYTLYDSMKVLNKFESNHLKIKIKNLIIDHSKTIILQEKYIDFTVLCNALFGTFAYLSKNNILEKENIVDIFQIVLIYGTYLQVRPKKIIELFTNMAEFNSLDKQIVSTLVKQILSDLYIHVTKENHVYAEYMISDNYPQERKLNALKINYFLYKVNKFWQNSLLSHIIEKDNDLEKIAYFVNIQYLWFFNAKKINLEYVNYSSYYCSPNNEINFVDMYDLEFEKYLINNI